MAFNYKDEEYYQKKENRLFHLEYKWNELQYKCSELEDKCIDDAKPIKLLKMENELQKLKKKIEDESALILSKKLKEYYNYVLKNAYSESNAYFCDLYDGTKIIETLDEFLKSKKEFLVLIEQFYLNKNHKYVDLILAKDLYDFSIEDDSPVMSDLKRLVGKSIYWSLNNKRPQRLKPFLETLQTIDNEYDFDVPKNMVVIKPLDQPYQIGGQTSLNRIGYGYWGEGTFYGETTAFMIVGIAVREY